MQDDKFPFNRQGLQNYYALQNRRVNRMDQPPGSEDLKYLRTRTAFKHRSPEHKSLNKREGHLAWAADASSQHHPSNRVAAHQISNDYPPSNPSSNHPSNHPSSHPSNSGSLPPLNSQRQQKKELFRRERQFKDAKDEYEGAKVKFQQAEKALKDAQFNLNTKRENLEKDQKNRIIQMLFLEAEKEKETALIIFTDAKNFRNSCHDRLRERQLALEQAQARNRMAQ